VTISPENRYRARLVIMVKEPRAGRVKTRLGRDIGMTASAWWFRHQAGATIRTLRDPRWQMLLSITPDRDAKASRFWPAALPRMAQGGGDLGVRMVRIFRQALPGPVIIVGGDIPGITRTHIARAFGALANHDAVFGPASDGGYWLVGMARRRPTPRRLFQGVRWSSEHALTDSLASAAGLRVALVDQLSDVDSAADLQR
jgi:uncharacterized protein